MERQFKFALVGYGHIGKVHEEAIKQLPNTQLVAIIDAANIDSQLPCFSNLQEFSKANIAADAVIIATPNGLHYAMAKESLELGYHVVVEKPITLNTQDLADLIYLAEAKQKRLFNMLQLRFSPVVQWVKSLLEKNAFGKVYMVNTQCYWNRNAAYYQKRKWHGSKTTDGGVLFTQFSHFVDVLHYWFSQLKVKDIRSYNFNHVDLTEFADSGSINFEIPNGGCGNLIYTTSVYEKNFDSTITIVAEKGTLQIAGQYMNAVRFLNIEGEDNPFETETGRHFHAQALEEVRNAILNQQPSILDAENARNVIQFLEVVS